MHLPRPESVDETDPILPLINIVFLLLIFFIMTGALHAVDFFAVDPPLSASEAHAVLDDTVVLVGADGRVAIGNVAVTEDALQAAVAARLAADADTVFRIKADGRVDAARVVAVMERLEAAGVRRVILLTLGRDR